MPLTSRLLGSLGLTPQRTYDYVQSGWLEKLGRGVFVRPGAPLSLEASLRALESSGLNAHVGGKTALDWYGVRHFVSVKPKTLLYGSGDERLPPWVTAHFSVEYRRKNLFRPKVQAALALSRFRDQPGAPLVSEPERAVLEMLSEVPQRQSLTEARELVQSFVSLRPELMQQLLRTCRSIKTVRLFLTLSRELKMPYLNRLNVKKLPTGGKSRWVVRVGNQTLTLNRP
jgi:hypothetical protein